MKDDSMQPSGLKPAVPVLTASTSRKAPDGVVVSAGQSAEPAEENAEALESSPWTAEQAAQWRKTQPALVPAQLVLTQAAASGAGVLASVLVWGWSPVGASVAWGCWAVVLPAALMAWGVGRVTQLAGVGLFRFFAWEWVKLGLSVVLMLLAPWVVPGLSGLAMLAGVILAVKAHGLALWLLMRRRRGLESKNDLNTED